MNNTIYGKAMENVRNKTDIELGNNKKKNISNVHQNQAICHTEYFTLIYLWYVKVNLH